MFWKQILKMLSLTFYCYSMVGLNILADGRMSAHKQWLDQSLLNCSIPKASWHFCWEICVTLILGDGKTTFFVMNSTHILLGKANTKNVQPSCLKRKCSPVEFGSLSLIQFCLVLDVFVLFGLAWKKGHSQPSCLVASCTDALKSYPARCLEGAIHPPDAHQMKHLLCFQNLTFPLLLPSYCNGKLHGKQQL